MSATNSAEINSAKAEKIIVSLTCTNWLDFIPKIPYLPSDEEVIPGTERYKDRLPKWMIFVELTKYVRYWDRNNVSITVVFRVDNQSQETESTIVLERLR